MRPPDGALAARLLDALAAGERAGGDERGDNLSAALSVHAPDPELHHNLRVDVPGTPVADLREAYETARAYGDDDADYSEERGGPVPDGAREFRIRY